MPLAQCCVFCSKLFETRDHYPTICGACRRAVYTAVQDLAGDALIRKITMDVFTAAGDHLSIQAPYPEKTPRKE